MQALHSTLALSACLVALAQQAAWSQNYPTRPIRYIVPAPPGGAPDALARQTGQKLAEALGQSVVVDNRAGGNGIIGSEIAAHAVPDGYTIVMGYAGPFSINPALYPKLPYDPVKDFDPLLPLFRAHFFVTVPSSSKYKTVGDILADARANPDKLNYGSWSIGNPVHLGSALLEAMSGTQMQHVPYKEVPMLYAGVANGELDWALGTMASAGPLQRTGKLKFIGVTAPKRLAAYPDVPTVSESGGPAGYEVSGWTALAAPKGLPKAVVDKIQADIAAALAEPDMKERYANFGYEPFPVVREQFSQFISAESAKYAEIVKRAKASLD